jgi:hypothetical protein
MTRAHRLIHRVIWPGLALAVMLGVALALWLRPPPEQGQTGLDPQSIPRAGPQEQPG